MVGSQVKSLIEDAVAAEKEGLAWSKMTAELAESAYSYYKEHYEITEQLKEENQLLWDAKMNMVKEQATEIVNHYLIRA